MTSSNPSAADLLPLSEAVFRILLSLADEERHGYAIMQDVAEQTDGEVQLGPGTLYGAIKRLRSQGIVEEVSAMDGSDGDERRRHYRLTPLGRQVAGLEARRLAGLVEEARVKKLIPALGAS